MRKHESVRLAQSAERTTINCVFVGFNPHIKSRLDYIASFVQWQHNCLPSSCRGFASRRTHFIILPFTGIFSGICGGIIMWEWYPSLVSHIILLMHSCSMSILCIHLDYIYSHQIEKYSCGLSSRHEKLPVTWRVGCQFFV